MSHAAALKFALTSFLFAVVFSGTGLVQARQDQQNRSAESSPADIFVAELPKPGRVTYELIRQGGPFP